MKNLKCEIKVNDNGNEFVGINIKNNKLILHLPIGYSCEEKNKIIEAKNISKNLKNEIRNIMLLLSKKTKKDLEENEYEVDIDFLSAIKVLNDYNNYGLYKQTEIKRRNNFKGRINWQRTIHQNQTYIDGKIIYTNVVNEYIDYKCEREIQQIQEICLYEISETIGFLLDFTYPKNISKFNKLEMEEILEKELKSTNEDIKNEMLNNLLRFVKNTNFTAIEEGSISIKYKEFQYIFEELVDYYGIKNKEDYFPREEYRYSKEDKIYQTPKPSEPDTIIKDNKELSEFNNEIFILDAKYKGHLPNEYDIFKQIRYKKYLEDSVKVKEKKEYKNIKNAFILPRNLQGEEGKVKVETFYATSIDYAEEAENKEKVYVVYVDTKSLILDTKSTMKEVLYKIFDK